ncbi:MAG TPA: hypothetical protein VIU61_18130 [Kofleriaceae bacterium]
MVRVLVAMLMLLATSAEAGVITGRVVQDGFRVAEYGVTIAGLSVSVRDGDGRFTLPHLPPGKYQLVLVGWAFARKTLTVELGVSKLDLGTIKVDAGRALAGRVVDAAGSLVAGATIIVYETRPQDLTVPEMELLHGGAQVATSSHDGTFRVLGLPDDLTGLRALAFSGDAGSAEHLVSGHSVELPVGRTGTLSGRITNRRRMQSPVMIATPAGFAGKPVLAGVDPTGRFRFDLPAGLYNIAFADEIAAPLQVAVIEDEMRGVTLTAPTKHLNLTVASPDCTYVRLLGARPGSSVPDTEIGFQVCDEGRASFHWLPPGRYGICVDADEDGPCNVVTLRKTQVIRVVRERVRLPSHPHD